MAILEDIDLLSCCNCTTADKEAERIFLNYDNIRGKAKGYN
jgi:hypothetical protein